MEIKSTRLFWICEINLLLWMSSLGVVIMNHFGETWKPGLAQAALFPNIAGCIVAALLQHWAYYKVYKPIREQRKKKTAEPDRRGDLAGGF